MVRWDKLQKPTGNPDALGILTGSKSPQDILNQIYASTSRLAVEHDGHASRRIEYICESFQSGVWIGKVMKNASAGDQVKRSIQLANFKQAHLPKFKIGEAMFIAKAIRMSETG